MARLAMTDAADNESVLLVINCGSSSLKAACFISDKARQNFHYRIDTLASVQAAFCQLFTDLQGIQPALIAHRFVFGGQIAQTARQITPEEFQRLEGLITYSPLHLPLHLLGVRQCSAYFCHQQGISQWACFDNVFHSHLPELAYRFPIPQAYQLRRVGFHGLNYAYVAKQLTKYMDSNIAHGRIVIAHLGSGCSLCLLKNRVSIDTTMGYSTAGGMPMATRSGDLDPGILLALSQKLDAAQLQHLIFHQSGLLALSGGESSDMQALLDSDSPAAHFAVDYFARSVRAAIGAYAAKEGGIDALVFTGGIGEHAAPIRKRICAPLSFLGFEISDSANQTHQLRLHQPSSKPILIIAADEEAEIAAIMHEVNAR